MYSFPDYLKKYSNISSRFIDEFYGLHDSKIDYEGIYINFDSVVNFLKVRKDSLKKTLIETYTENIDYTIKKSTSTIGGTIGRPSEMIYLSYDCFRKLCMVSRTQKGDEVRSYYIEVEKHLFKYLGYITKSVKKSTKSLIKNP